MENELVLQERIDRKTLEEYLMGQANVEKLTEAQRNTFYQIASINNLHPFKRQIYAIPRFNKQTQKYDLSIVTGYEVYLSRAEATGMLDGWEADYVDNQGDDYAFCTIYRKDMKHPITQKAWLKEFDQGTHIWATKKRTMLIKCAIAICFRRAFSGLQGLPYTADEMPIGEAEVVQPTLTPPPEQKPVPEATGLDKQAPQSESEEVKKVTDAQLKRLFAVAGKSDKSKSDIKGWLEDHGMMSSKELTPERYEELVVWVETPNHAPCPDGDMSFPLSYCNGCIREIECDKRV
jgi:hypothetical protein